MKRTWIAAGATALIAVVLAVAFALQDTSSDQLGSEPGGVGPAHCGGQETTFEEAMAGAPYSLSLADETSMASMESLEGVWDCPADATLLEFSSGVTITATENTAVDPEVSWQGLAESNPKIYSVGTVQGVPALLIDPDGDDADDALGGVTFVLDGVSVNVGGDGRIPLEDLTKVAEDLQVSLASS